VTEELFLFIGGSHDGERRTIHDRSSIIEVVKYDPQPVDFIGPPSLSYETEVYEAFPLAAEKHRFTVYVLKGIRPHEVMIALISNYPTQEVQELARRTRRR